MHSKFRGADQCYANAMLRGFDPERRLSARKRRAAAARACAIPVLFETA
jgi:hypothetical protein